ncbi:MAG: dihydroneopterin aldolase [Prevotella sp.]|nr:dihydroneopterin aldolase [Prevotella sp.]
MIIERSYILLKELRFHAYHGVMPQERKVGGDFIVSLRVGIDLSRPVASDDVADTLNYATLYKVVKREMMIPSQLLEHVGGRIGEAVLDAFPQAVSVDLTLMKLNPPMGADSKGAGVELYIIR